MSAEPAKIGRSSRADLMEALATNAVSIAAITPWEIATKASRGKLRLAAPTLDWLNDVLARTASP